MTKGKQSRKYWMVCKDTLVGWTLLRGFFSDREQAEKKLRWLRQWHPKAFLVSALMVKCESESREAPLPSRIKGAQPVVAHQLMTGPEQSELV